MHELSGSMDPKSQNPGDKVTEKKQCGMVPNVLEIRPLRKISVEWYPMLVGSVLVKIWCFQSHVWIFYNLPVKICLHLPSNFYLILTTIYIHYAFTSFHAILSFYFSQKLLSSKILIYSLNLSLYIGYIRHK